MIGASRPRARRLSLALAAGATASALGASVPAHIEGPPPGHTGGFGEPACNVCHNEFGLNEPGGELRVEGLGTSYAPGRLHTVTVLLRVEDTQTAGFQAAFRFTDGPREGASAGVIEPLDARVGLNRAEDSEVVYVQTKREGTRPATADLTSWSFLWTAPEDGGRVRVDVAANSGNGDASPLGDLIYTKSLTLEPARQ